MAKYDIYSLKRIDEFENLSWDQLQKISSLLEPLNNMDEIDELQSEITDLEDENEGLKNDLENLEWDQQQIKEHFFNLKHFLDNFVYEQIDVELQDKLDEKLRKIENCL